MKPSPIVDKPHRLIRESSNVLLLAFFLTVTAYKWTVVLVDGEVYVVHLVHHVTSKILCTVGTNYPLMTRRQIQTTESDALIWYLRYLTLLQLAGAECECCTPGNQTKKSLAGGKTREGDNGVCLTCTFIAIAPNLH